MNVEQKLSVSLLKQIIAGDDAMKTTAGKK